MRKDGLDLFQRLSVLNGRFSSKRLAEQEDQSVPAEAAQDGGEMVPDPGAEPSQDDPETGDGGELPMEKPPDDDYSGPQEDQVVGDDRTVQLSALAASFDGVQTPLGEAWQDEDGELHGSGAAAVVLFEPVSRQDYRNASLAVDYSPLTVMGKRFSRCTLLSVAFVEGQDEPQ